MNYLNIKETAQKWGLTERRVQTLCKEGKIVGAVRFGKVWMVPENANKPADKRRTETVSSKTKGFLLPAPKENPYLIHTDLYSTPGTADEVIASFHAYPETAKIFKAQVDARRGDMDEVLKEAEHFLANHSGFYSTLATGISLSFCAIYKGDINLWRKARRHLYSAPYNNDQELQMIRFWSAVVDSNINDTRDFPNWFLKGDFSCLPADSFCTARVFYAKALFINTLDLASGKGSFENITKLGLMRALPFVLEPMISQAVMEKTLIPEAYLRLMLATVYRNLGTDKEMGEHIEKALDICLPDRLYGILCEYRNGLGNALDDRITARDKDAFSEVKKIHKKMNAGWIRLHNFMLERNVSSALSVREREVARFAAMGLSNNEIASRLKIEPSSVKQYVFQAMNKCGVSKRGELGLYV